MNSTDRLKPSPVPGLAHVVAIGADGAHTCALKTDGSAACRGRNLDGQVGDGTRIGKTAVTPVEGGAVYWK